MTREEIAELGIALGRAYGFDVATSDETTYILNGKFRSAFQQNETAIRLADKRGRMALAIISNHEAAPEKIERQVDRAAAFLLHETQEKSTVIEWPAA